jgi:16S rRNA (guanine527-N7)-methyltransferase
VTSRGFSERLRRRARRAGVTLPVDTAKQLRAYFDLLVRWNQKINLTALDDQDEAIDRLLMEPLIAARQIPSSAAVLLDVGSGGGSPAIPLKLALPSITLWMVESKTRKAAFLREAIRQLELTNTYVETARYEELLARPDLHEALDVVTVRALRVESRALLSLQAFLRPGGLLLWFRGPGGPEVPANLPPPLVVQAVHPLVDTLSSRLVILNKVR